MKRILSGLSGAVVAVLCLTLLAAPLQGCFSQTTIADLTQTLGTAAANLATLEGNTTLATKLSADTAAAVTAITNWKSGSPVQEVIEALNLVEDDLSLFPITSQYAPLIDLAIGTAESILSLLPASATPTASHVRHVEFAAGHPAPKNAKQFKSQWNGYIAQHPELGAAKLQ